MSDGDEARGRTGDEAVKPPPHDHAPNIRIATGVEQVSADGPRVRVAPPRVPLTYAIIAVCVGITAALNLLPPGDLPIGRITPTSPRIWQGAVWGLVTSAFVHLAVWHLAFNMWWARDFGRLLEPGFGIPRYLGFVVGAAVVSSGWQLLVTGATGIGFSGVVYALFGYVAARRGSIPAYAAFLTRQTMMWMLGWLVVCIALTFTKMLNVANTAHISGLAFGWLVGIFLEKPRLKVLAVAGLGVLAIGAVMSVSYMPWSADWRDRKTSLSDLDVVVRQAEKSGDPSLQARVGGWLLTLPERRKEGVTMLRKSAEAGDAGGMNGLAWVLATSTDPELRNGEEAVGWATRATNKEPIAAYTDTLAAALAEAGRWDEAVAAQRLALQRLSPDATPEQRASLEKHLAQLERRDPIRE